MRKVVSLLLVVVFVLAFSSVAFATVSHTEGAQGLDNSPAFEKDTPDGWETSDFFHKDDVMYFGAAGAINIGTTVPAENSDELEYADQHDNEWSRLRPASLDKE